MNRERRNIRISIEEPVYTVNKLGMLEALLFSADEPLDEKLIAQASLEILEAEVPELVNRLEELYRENGHGITIQRVAGGWRLATRAEYAEIVKRLMRGKLRAKLSRAALETVSIIAYRQPVSRAEIEAIRGVDPTPVLKTLLERELVRITGRADAPGRPLLYGTTQRFLTYFGLESLDDLPKPEEILGDTASVNPAVTIPEGPFTGEMEEMNDAAEVQDDGVDDLEDAGDTDE